MRTYICHLLYIRPCASAANIASFLSKVSASTGDQYSHLLAGHNVSGMTQVRQKIGTARLNREIWSLCSDAWGRENDPCDVSEPVSPEIKYKACR